MNNQNNIQNMQGMNLLNYNMPDSVNQAMSGMNQGMSMRNIDSQMQGMGLGGEGEGGVHKDKAQ